MPEHTIEHEGGTGADDLDVRFVGLVDEIGARSRPPGAAQAQRSGTIRRAAFGIGAALVVLALVVGIGGWVARAGRVVAVPAAPQTSTVLPSSTASSDPDRPAPARLTVDRLNEASRGWVVWAVGTADVTGVSPCRGKDGPASSAGEATIEHFHHLNSVDASLERLQFGSVADSNLALRALLDELENCSQRASYYTTGFGDRADLEVTAYRWGTNQHRGVVWLMNFGNRVDVLTALGASRPSDDTVHAVSRLLAEDVQAP